MPQHFHTNRLQNNRFQLLGLPTPGEATGHRPKLGNVFSVLPQSVPPSLMTMAPPSQRHIIGIPPKHTSIQYIITNVSEGQTY